MFGSLVIIFPTPHEGGELVIRRHREDDTKEWTVDSTRLLTGATEPSIAYVAFYSDTEHEVLPVRSGYRVTLTYNLYYVKNNLQAPTHPVLKPVPTNEDSFRSALQRALDDEKFLPEGGNLMFCFHHKYPLPTDETSAEKGKQALQNVTACLKATDAVMWKVVKELKLDASPKVLYEDRNEHLDVMCDRVYPLQDEDQVEGSLSSFLEYHAGGRSLRIAGSRARPWEERPYSYRKKRVEVEWVNYRYYKFMSGDGEKTTYMAYGNQASIGVAYWKICMFVRVGPPGKRDVPLPDHVDSDE